MYTDTNTINNIYKNNLGILIVAPHSLCNVNLDKRNCDTRAQESAITFYNILIKKNINVNILLADQYRYNIDLNRIVSRNTKFRKSINNELDKLTKKYKYVWLIECHSFPIYRYYDNNLQKYIINNPFYSDKNKNPKLVFLYLKNTIAEQATYIASKNLLLSNNNRFSLLEGSKKNDIQYLTNKEFPNVYTILIEVAENKDIYTNNEMKEDITNIINSILHFVKINFMIELQHNYNNYNDYNNNITKNILIIITLIILLLIIIIFIYFIYKILNIDIMTLFNMNI